MSHIPAPLPPYQKPWLSHADQVQLLIGRGLTVADANAAAQFLSHINYYRFSGYCLAFEQNRHQFIAGTTFEQVRAAYEFDMAVRDLVTEALEAIEVDLRSVVAYEFGHARGAFGHADPTSFHPSFWHQDWIDRIRTDASRSNETFVTHFRQSYAQFPDLPIWVAMELMSFGSLSQMFKFMFQAEQHAVSTRYGLGFAVLKNWMHHLVYVRNLCAHHSRLWDRSFAIKPIILKAWHALKVPAGNRLFATFLLMRHLLKRCPAISAFASDWRDRVNALMQNPPAIPDPLGRMGMPANWNQHPVWK
jgi:abortive infection bacteriophage resistance protein